MKRRLLFSIMVSIVAFTLPFCTGKEPSLSGQEKEGVVKEKKSPEEAHKKRGEVFKGIVIFLGESKMELKRGSAEMMFHFTAETPVTFRGKPAGTAGLRLCQRVRAVYQKTDTMNQLVSLNIITPGYCGR